MPSWLPGFSSKTQIMILDQNNQVIILFIFNEYVSVLVGNLERWIQLIEKENALAGNQSHTMLSKLGEAESK